MLPFSARVAAALAIAALLQIHPTAQDSARTRVLIIGNSLTFANNLPSMLEAVARASGARALECGVVALPDFGLQEHWEDGRALRMLRRGGWTHVVLQQGPTSLPESRRILLDYTRRFAPEIRAIGASILLYGVWPTADRPPAFDAVAASYAAAADDVGGTAVLVGGAWKQALREDPSMALYGPDGFHPSALGTYAAAVMLFEAITGRPPAPLPAAANRREPALRAIIATPAQIAIVEKAASAVSRMNRRR
jgi:hypothetical protein